MSDREKVIKGLEDTQVMLTKAVDRGGDMAVMSAFNCLNNVTRALALLKEQEVTGMSEWISVKDALPEEDKTVLVARKYVVPGHMEKRYVETATRIGHDWVSDADEYKINRRFHTQPYAWMPLPEPPKEVTGNA